MWAAPGAGCTLPVPFQNDYVYGVQVNPAGTKGDKTIIEGDINGDKIADFQIELTGLKTLAASDFIL